VTGNCTTFELKARNRLRITVSDSFLCVVMWHANYGFKQRAFMVQKIVSEHEGGLFRKKLSPSGTRSCFLNRFW